MEDLIGIVIFVVFMVLRARKDRQQNMNRKQKKVKTAAPPVRESVSTKKVERINDKRTEPVYSVKTHQEKTASPKKKTAKVENFKAEQVKERQQGQDLTTLKTKEEEHNKEVLTARDLRKAVIWSEVLDKPRFKTRKLNYR